MAHTRLFVLRDEAGVRGETLVPYNKLADRLHSWYLQPDHPDVIEHPATRETLEHAHRTIDELVATLGRGEPVEDLADDLDVKVLPLTSTSSE